MNRHSFIALLVLLACSSCSLTKEQEPGFGRRMVEFGIDLGNGGSKLVGSYFKENDEVWISGGSPVDFWSEYYFTDGGWSCRQSPIYWGEKQTEASTFLMTYPPNSFIYKGGGSDHKDFSDYVYEGRVYEDQSEEFEYSRSDVMMAITKAAPSDGTVHLTARHMFSLVNINVTNNSGAGIEKLILSGVKTVADVPVLGEISPTGENADIFTYNLSGSEDGKNSVWSAVVVPQTASPKIVVILSTGEQQTWSLPEGHTFKSGKKTDADIVLAADRQRLELKLAVGEWKTGGSLEFITEEQN